MDERDIQTLVADFPWLLDLDYESVPQLKRKGMEQKTPNQNRVDLILRHRVTKRPVLVEFKAGGITRDAIGQILGYRSQCIAALTEDDSVLRDVFDDYLCSPILVLVVANCSEEARIACNLVGIDIYEYGSRLRHLQDASGYRDLEQMSKSLNRSALPVTIERRQRVEEIDERIEEVLEKLGVPDGFISFGKPKGMYYDCLANFFINKWLFQGSEISIGIYEDIFKGVFDEITIEYYSESREGLEHFRLQLVERPWPTRVPEVTAAGGSGGEYCLPFREKKKDFVDDVSIIGPYVMAYLDILIQKERSPAT